MIQYEGEIIGLSNYYGVISFKETRQISSEESEESIDIERKIPFFPGDISIYNIGDKVQFIIPIENCKDNQVIIRSQHVKFAKQVNIIQSNQYIKKESNGDFYQLLNEKISPSPNVSGESSLLNFLKNNNLRYSVFNDIAVLLDLIDGTISILDFKHIIEIDKKYKEFIMKWVLFIENSLKNRIESTFVEFSIDVHDFMNKVNQSSDNEMKNLWKKSLNRIRKNYLLRNSGDLRLVYKNEMDKIPELDVTPIDMILDEFTVGDLLIFIKFVMKQYPDFKTDTTSEWEKIYDFLSELKLVRNISAHGNSFLSEVLDRKNNPNYLLEENAELFGSDPFYVNTSKNYSIFNLVRSPIKLTSKGYTSSPQEVAVSITSKLLNNHTLRSFFYFYFMVCYLTNDTEDKVKFKNDLRVLFGEYNKIVNLDKVIINIVFCSNIDEENKQLLLTRLLPQAINMFDFVKEHNYEYNGINGDTIYEVIYNNRIVKINLGDNAEWYLKMILDIKQKYPNEKEFWTLPECEEIREKFWDFFIEGSNARETLVRIFDENLEKNIDNGIVELSKIKEFSLLRYLFLDVLDIFS